jgi:hypothetical protein
MAKQIPAFLTGANAKIKVNDVVLAFATDISYAISINHVSPRVLGRYEVEEHQPVRYDVKGSFTVIRYTDAPGIKSFQPTQTITTNPADNPNPQPGQLAIPSQQIVAAGSPQGGIKDANKDKGNGIGSWEKNGDIFTSGGAVGSLDPSKFHRAMSFDIEIWQKTGDGDHAIARFRNCRISHTGFKLTKKSEARQVFEFIAQYGDEDTFVTGESGVGQQYS